MNESKAKTVCKRLTILALIALLLGLAGAADRAQGKALVGFSDDVETFGRYGAQSVHANATGARIILGWDTPATGIEVTRAMEELHIATTPIFTLYTLDDVPLDAYADQCRAFARAWPHAVISAGNEPNIHIGGFQPVPQVVAQAQACEQAVHQVDPNRRVLGPAIAPVNMDDAAAFGGDFATYRSNDNAQWHHYMSRVYDQLDGVEVAMNIYPYGEDPIEKLREDLRWGKNFGKVWITETAMLGDYGPKRAAKLAAKSSRWLSKHGARSVMFHRLAQGPVDPIGWRTFALTSAGKRTALYKALRRAWKT